MAVTSVWPIKAGKRSVAGTVKVVVDYAMNPEKTTEELRPEISALHTIDNVVQYAANDLTIWRLSSTSPLKISSK